MNQKKIGDFIAALRKEKEVTQQELGNTSESQIRLFPAGKLGNICRI